MALKAQKNKYTPEEYLALEEKAEFRSEYDNGEIGLESDINIESLNIELTLGEIYQRIEFEEENL